MTMRRAVKLLSAFAVFLFASVQATAVTTAGSGSVLVVPIVAQTGSFASEVTVHNLASGALTLNVDYYDANGLATAGKRTCSQLVVQPNEARAFTLSAQCTLGAGSHFGLLVLEDAAVEKINLFTAYSRTQTPQGQGFSIEGFPIGNFSGQIASVVGLKRVAAAPVFQTNCFIAAL